MFRYRSLRQEVLGNDAVDVVDQSEPTSDLWRGRRISISATNEVGDNLTNDGVHEVHHHKRPRLVNRTRNTVLHASPHWATSQVAWTFGLMFHATRDCALIFHRQTPIAIRIHSFFVRGALDILILDETMRVSAMREGLLPFRYWNSQRRSNTFIELASGTIRRTGTEIGDVIDLPG